MKKFITRLIFISDTAAASDGLVFWIQMPMNEERYGDIKAYIAMSYAKEVCFHFSCCI
jgi:hypothetical protein